MREILEIVGKPMVEHDDNISSDTISSLKAMMSDPRDIEDIYTKGDWLTLDGQHGEVVGQNGHSLIIRFPDGYRIVPRNDPDLEPAPVEFWK